MTEHDANAEDTAAAKPLPSQELKIPDLEPQEVIQHYLELYKVSVDVQKHFNEIEWKIRGLALTVATFALGAAGVSAQNAASIGPLSLGAAVLVLGLVLWYAFYYVDRYWYHPLLKGAVKQGTVFEATLAQYLPSARMTAVITEESAQDAGWLIRLLSGALRRKKNPDGKMHSDHKLKWFYSVGGLALTLAALGLQIATCFSAADLSTPPAP